VKFVVKGQNNMKNDLDRLMQENDIDAILVTGSGQHNPAMVYLTGGGFFSGDYIKKRGQPGVLFHDPMERDEASRSGLALRSYADYPYPKFLEQAGGNRYTARALMYQQMLTDVGFSTGCLALYGTTDLGNGVGIFTKLHERMPGLDFAGDRGVDLLGQARMTKDAAEVERIRRVGQATVSVVGKTADFLTHQTVREGVLVRPDGSPLTIGDVKSKIDLWLAEAGLEAPEGTIFSIGRDAGVPHSSGIASDWLRLGQTIVFDIYPCEQGGGYFYDFTRTWCLGHASPEIQRIYGEVLQVFTTLRSELKPDSDFFSYQKRTCDLFSALGHATPLTAQDPQEGYVHGLGHGVGLDIHEHPFGGATSQSQDVLKPGVVITLEPGLYYPEKGFGVRLEDTMWITPEGKFETLAYYPLDLILPMHS
jgi:Xaa-Pro aminopeptidase